MTRPFRRGACGFVQLALDTVTGGPVAVKFISRTKGFNAQTAGRELLNHRACAGHRHVVQLQVPLNEKTDDSEAALQLVQHGTLPPQSASLGIC
jgi:hypothetical protein